MATYYRYKRPITNSGAITSETMDVETWKAGSTDTAALAFQDTSGNIHDYSEFVLELNIVHNDVDGDEAGRDKTFGARMKRSYLGNKHTLTVKMVNHLQQIVAHQIFLLIRTTVDKTSFRVWYQSPCTSTYSACTSKEVYCATINYGSQRYDRKTQKCYYDGMTFNLIEM